MKSVTVSVVSLFSDKQSKIVYQMRKSKEHADKTGKKHK